MRQKKRASALRSDRCPLLIYRRYEEFLMKAFGEKNLLPDIFCVCDDPRVRHCSGCRKVLQLPVFPRSMEDLCTDLPIRIIEEEKLKTRILLAWKKDRRSSACDAGFYQYLSGICRKSVFEMIFLPVFPFLNSFRILLFQPFFQLFPALFQPFQNFRMLGQGFFLSACHGCFSRS